MKAKLTKKMPKPGSQENWGQNENFQIQFPGIEEPPEKTFGARRLTSLLRYVAAVCGPRLPWHQLGNGGGLRAAPEPRTPGNTRRPVAGWGALSRAAGCGPGLSVLFRPRSPFEAGRGI